MKSFIEALALIYEFYIEEEDKKVKEFLKEKALTIMEWGYPHRGNYAGWSKRKEG